MRVILSFVLIASCMAVSPAPLAAQVGEGSDWEVPSTWGGHIWPTEEIEESLSQLEDLAQKRYTSHSPGQEPVVRNGALSRREVYGAMSQLSPVSLHKNLKNAVMDLLKELFPGFPNTEITAEMIENTLHGVDVDKDGFLSGEEVENYLRGNPKTTNQVIKTVQAAIEQVESFLRLLAIGDSTIVRAILKALDIEGLNEAQEKLREILADLKKLLERLRELQKEPAVELPVDQPNHVPANGANGEGSQ